jgi:hypothetical protein
MNCTAQPQTISFDPATSGIKGLKVTPLLTDDPALQKATSLKGITLAPYASWMAGVE